MLVVQNKHITRFIEWPMITFEIRGKVWGMIKTSSPAVTDSKGKRHKYIIDEERHLIYVGDHLRIETDSERYSLIKGVRRGLFHALISNCSREEAKRINQRHCQQIIDQEFLDWEKSIIDAFIEIYYR